MEGNDNGKNVIIEKMSHRINLMIKPASAALWNNDKIFLKGYVMLLYVNSKHSILFTWKNI